ncbi:hypothetical protein LKV13_02810 [Borrelia sp. BU AG58]|uniref:hypothetical protein n=1 Tax=Borrelia sp. BU AG58 TaxID=2887345 RepID=UPI001E53F220|nr:hypothetical protein [Borrelia sp. BU AG58]UER67717.1 hypothetical protein LKV13_02810 [Borrelia sp. BU AG58]
MNLESVDEIWGLPVCCDSRGAIVENFTLLDEYKDQICSISYKDDIVLKFNGIVDSDDFNLKLFDNKLAFEGQVSLVLYSGNLNVLLEAEKSISFELKAIGQGEGYSESGTEELDQVDTYRSYYEFSDYVNCCKDSLMVKVYFEGDFLIVDAAIDNTVLLKKVISDSFCINRDKIVINSFNDSCINTLFPIYFNAVLQGVVLAVRLKKKVNIVYYKRHFLMASSLRLKFSAINCLSVENKLSKIVLDLEINRPLNFLYKFYFNYLKRIFNNLFFDFKVHINFIASNSDIVFFYDNHFLFETSVYNFIYSNLYNLAMHFAIEPLGYLLAHVKTEYDEFLKFFEQIDLKNSIMRKSSSVSLNSSYGIFDVSRKSVGFSFIDIDTVLMGGRQTISMSLHKNKLDIFIPYKILDDNLINYLRNALAREFGLAYDSVGFVIGDACEDDVGALIKESYFIGREILAVKKNLSLMVGENFKGDYPVVIEQDFVLSTDTRFKTACSLEIGIKIYSFEITFRNVTFFVQCGKIDKIGLNNKRAFSVFSLAASYVFGKVNYDIDDSLTFEFFEDGEDFLSFRALFISSVSAIRTALIQAFGFNLSRIPIEMEDVLNNWSVKIDTD